jgi:hypothetical protein
MKTKQVRLMLFALIASVIALFSFNSCATKAPFLSSAIVPAAKGTVKVSKDANKNYHININISDLAGSERLTPPKKTYVVWLIAQDNMAKNIGQINISNSLSGKFETVSAFPPSKIMITAEDEANVVYPSNSDMVLITDYLK